MIRVCRKCKKRYESEGHSLAMDLSKCYSCNNNSILAETKTKRNIAKGMHKKHNKGRVF